MRYQLTSKGYETLQESPGSLLEQEEAILGIFTLSGKGLSLKDVGTAVGMPAEFLDLPELKKVLDSLESKGLITSGRLSYRELKGLTWEPRPGDWNPPGSQERFMDKSLPAEGMKEWIEVGFERLEVPDRLEIYERED